MKDYNEMSDFEINVLVAEKLGVGAKIEDGCLFTSKKHAGENVISVTTFTDYCNNPADMWPLIFENKIDVCFIDSANSWTSFGLTKNKLLVDSSGDNPLRAAAIVYLMLKDEK